MKLMVPANYDLDLLPQLKDRSVTEIYGRLPTDIVGGGRPNYMAGPLSKKKLERYIHAVKQHGFEFNYLLNSACLGNREWTKTFQKKLHKLLDWLSELEVPWLTISTAYLTQVVKKLYPHFKVKVGIYAQVDTVKRAQYWESIGADSIVLESFSINRNFELLSQIRQAVSCELPLIANHFCQPNCPYQIQHQNGHAHASGEHCRFLVDFPIIQCQHARLTHPRLMVAAGWIRPEDTKVYEELGFSTFKLLERNIPSEEMLKRVEAYHSRSWPGNLAELIFSWGFTEKAPDFNVWHFLKTFRPWKTNWKFGAMAFQFLSRQGMIFPRKPSSRPPVDIQNSKLPADFINWFERIDCSNTDCDDCGFCDKVADKVVRIDPEFLSQVIPVYEKIQSQLIDGSFISQQRAHK